MRSFLYTIMTLGLGLSLTQGACKAKKKETKPKTGLKTSPNIPDNNDNIDNNDPDAGAKVPDPTAPATKDNTQAMQTFSQKVANKTWRLCRQWSATFSELVVTAMQDANDTYASTRTPYRSGDCSGEKLSQNESTQTGKFLVDGSPSADTWTYQIKIEDTTTHYAIVGIRDGKLYFGNYDGAKDGLSEAGRPSDLDMAEGYTDSGKEGFSTRYKK